MEILDRAALDILRDRCWSFYDGVIGAFTLTTRHPRRATILIECQDKESPRGWGDLVLEIDDVKDYRFDNTRSHFEVLSFGIGFVWGSGGVVVLLSPVPEDTDTMPDLSKIIAYVTGAQCSYSITARPAQT